MHVCTIWCHCNLQLGFADILCHFISDLTCISELPKASHHTELQWNPLSVHRLICIIPGTMGSFKKRMIPFFIKINHCWPVFVSFSSLNLSPGAGSSRDKKQKSALFLIMQLSSGTKKSFGLTLCK